MALRLGVIKPKTAPIHDRRADAQRQIASIAKPGSTAVVRAQGGSERRNTLLVQKNRSSLGKDSTCAEGHSVDASVSWLDGQLR